MDEEDDDEDEEEYCATTQLQVRAACMHTSSSGTRQNGRNAKYDIAHYAPQYIATYRA